MLPSSGLRTDRKLNRQQSEPSNTVDVVHCSDVSPYVRWVCLLEAFWYASASDTATVHITSPS